jgi:hypothetical protein
MCSRKLIGYLGFFRRGVFIGEGAMSEEEPGALTQGPRGQAPLLLSFGSLEASG